MRGSFALALAVSVAVVACAPAQSSPSPAAAAPAIASDAVARTPAELYAQMQGKTRDQQLALLEKGARAEGKLDLYTSAEAEIVQGWVALFKSAYPYVEVAVTRGSTREIAERFITQARAGQPQGDVFYAGVATLAQLRGEDLLAPHTIPDADRIPAELRNDHKLWDVTRLGSHHLVFNTKLTSAERLPNTFEGFTASEWKGRFAINSDAKEWFACQVKLRGQDAAAKLMRDLVANQPVIMEGKTALLERLALGDFPVNIDNTGSSSAASLKAGAPLGFKSIDPICVTLSGGGIATAAKHPNAAGLFLNFQTSDAVQKFFAASGYMPLTDSVQPLDAALRPKGVKLVYLTEVETDPAKYDPISKLHTEIVVRKR